MVRVPQVWLAVPWAVVVPRAVPIAGPTLAVPVNMSPVAVPSALVPGDLGLFAASVAPMFTCGPPGWVTSGDMSCVMRYNFEEICHQHTVSPVPPVAFTHFAVREPEGTMFCDSSLGTDRNLLGRLPCDFAQNAERGMCRMRLRIRDD